MNDPQPNDPMLQEARRTFAAFYESATMADAMLMEALIHAWANVTQGMKIPRDRVSAEHRAELERVVRWCPGLSDGDVDYPLRAPAQIWR